MPERVSRYLLCLLAGFALGCITEQAKAEDRPPGIHHVTLSGGKNRLTQTRHIIRKIEGTAKFDPRLIVEHWTGSEEQWPAVNYWNELGARGPWAQFMIDKDGTITQFGSIHTLAQHAFGVSHYAVGIEHVGTDAEEILSDSTQMRASYQLTCWLMDKLNVPLSGVIGHGEVPESRFLHLTDAGWQIESESHFHTDFQRTAMNRYRYGLPCRDAAIAPRRAA